MLEVKVTGIHTTAEVCFFQIYRHPDYSFYVWLKDRMQNALPMVRS
jgi:hypothetical protein